MNWMVVAGTAFVVLAIAAFGIAEVSAADAAARSAEVDRRRAQQKSDGGGT